MSNALAGAHGRWMRTALLLPLAAACLSMGTVSAGAQPAPPPYVVPDYPGADELPDIHLTMTDTNGPSATGAMQVNAFIDYMNRASKGKITVEVFWSSAVVAINEAPAGIASGLVDMGSTLPIYTPSDLPVNNYFSQLSFMTEGGFPGSTLVTVAAVSEFIATNKDIQKELSDFGIQAIGAGGSGGYDTLCTRPWHNLAEARGLRTRAAGQAFAFEAQELGMVPVPTTMTEVYEAFSRGILDCVILQPHSYVTLGITDVPGKKYWVNVPLTTFNGGVFMFNKAKWDSLPPVAQQIITDANTLYQSLVPNTASIGHKQFADLVEKGDIEPMAVDAEVVARLADYRKRQLEGLLTSAPAGVSDPQAFIDHYAALVDKWQAIVAELGYTSDRTTTDFDAMMAEWNAGYDFLPYIDRLREELNKARIAAN